MRMLSADSFIPQRCLQMRMPCRGSCHQAGTAFAREPAARRHTVHAGIRAGPQSTVVLPKMSSDACQLATELCKEGAMAGVEPALAQRLIQSMRQRDVAAGQQLVSAGAAATAVWLLPQDSCSGKPWRGHRGCPGRKRCPEIACPGHLIPLLQGRVQASLAVLWCCWAGRKP